MSLNKAIFILIEAFKKISLSPKNLKKIKKVLEEDNGDESIDLLELDSLGTMELCIVMELDHNILITPEDVFLCEKVSELIYIIKNQIED